MEGIFSMKKRKSILVGLSCLSILLAAGEIPASASDEIPEQSIMNPIGIRSCYDEGKRCAETLCFDYMREYGARIKVIRIFNTYGPNMSMDDGRVVSNFIVQALNGENITIYGDGSQTRSFCYVDDLVEGIVRVMATSDEVHGPVNLGNPEEFTIKELADMVVSMIDTDSRIEYVELPSDDPHTLREKLI